MYNCDYCGDFHNRYEKHCSQTCYELAHGKYDNPKILYCKDPDDYYCECRACLRAIFLQEFIIPIKEQHEQWLLIREML